MKARLAHIGGGSIFAPSIVNGIANVIKRSTTPFAVEISLYDVRLDKAERMRGYAEVVGRAWGVPVQATVARSRTEALEGADVVIVSVWLQDVHERLGGILDGLGFRLAQEGPELAGWVLGCAPWMLEVAAEMRDRCPDALFVTVTNPTDVISGVVAEGAGVRAAGLCVEVDGLRGALSYHLRVPYERIGLTHAGVNHDGWVLEFRVEGRDGYPLLRSRRQAIEGDNNYHPGTRGIWPILDLTGHLRSSAYHNWPYSSTQAPEGRAVWDGWRGKRERCEAAVDEALRTGQPISDPPLIHPERSRLNYPCTGLTVGRLLESVATGRPNVIPLQVPNRGAISNFPDGAIVEVPALVQGDTVTPQPVGELPDWLGGYTRLLAIQRRLIVEYVLTRRLATLKRAFAVLPMLGTVQQLNRLAEALHDAFSLTT